jgi:EmrB/QacA subfamily drug resistance transporter
MSDVNSIDRAGPGDRRRWLILGVIGLAQLMVVLDVTVMNIALPSAQRALHFTTADRQWVVTAYTLAFGSLLLLGGRLADLLGRKVTFLIGLLGFAGVSAIGGASVNFGMLITARACQGAFGAILVPSALSLLTTTFTEPKERGKAFGIYGAIAGGGGAVGFILGGVLTEYMNWRWTFFVNIPFAIVAALGAYFVIREPEGGRNRNPLDIPGVLLSTLGLVALVYGFTRAESNGWGDSMTVGMFVASAVLLIAFVVTEARTKAPLLPLRVITDRNRGGIYLSLGIAIIAMFGTFLFLTYYLQIVKGFTPIKTGFAFMPMIVGMMVGSTQIGARLMTRVPARLLMGPGFLVAAVGMLLMTQLEIGSSYASTILPAMLLLGLGMGTAFMPAMSLATLGVEPRDAGVASAMVNTSQQVGGAIGTALLNTIAASATTSYIADHIGSATSRSQQQLVTLEGQVHGYTNAIWFAVGMLVLAAVIVVTLVNAGRTDTAAVAESGEGAEEELAIPVVAH